jgi:hypothetical protein
LAKQNFFLATGLLATVIFAGACRGKHSRLAVENEEPAEAAPRMAATLKMNDPAAPAQLVKGVYGLEGGAWRWTAGHFSFLLRSPLSAAQHGATLTLGFTIPDVVTQKLGPLVLTASVGTTKLKSDTYAKPGPYTFTADVPAELLTKDSVTVDFALDKSIPAGAMDQRELGVIATSVGLESK